MGYYAPLHDGIFAHKQKIGSAIWEFLYLLTLITKEIEDPELPGEMIGLVQGGKALPYRTIASALGQSLATTRRNLRSLADHGYVVLVPIGIGEAYGFHVKRSKKFPQEPTAEITTPSRSATRGLQKCTEGVPKLGAGGSRNATANKEERNRKKEREIETNGALAGNGQNVAHLVAHEQGITDRPTILAIADQITLEMQSSGKGEVEVADEIRTAIKAYKATDDFSGKYRKSWKTFFGDRDTWRKFVSIESRKVITPSQAQEMALARSR